MEEARAHLTELKDIFGDRLFLEIQPFNEEDQIKANIELIKLSEEFGIKLITGTDSHYVNKEDHYIHDILLCIGTGAKLTDEVRFRFKNEFWFMSYDEVIEHYEQQMKLGGIPNEYEYECAIQESLNNTELLADMVEPIKLKSDKPIMPLVDVPEGFDDNSYLRHQCWINLYKYLRDNNLWHKRSIYEARLNHELNVICTKGYASYFLIVQDFIEWGNNNGCPFGPGRGSAAGSLVAFLLGIVKGTDPIEYDLLFFRFLTMDRKALPDIDSDVSRLDRQKVIDYMEHKYHMENTCQVGTWTVVGVKNGLKDVARVLDLPFAEANELTKNFDDGITWKDIDAMEGEEKKAIDLLEEKYSEIFRVARKLAGCKRNCGIHAGGFIAAPDSINTFVPTRTANGRKVSLWDKNEVEDAGLCKIDLLGLATTSMINLCTQFIEKTTGIKITLDDLYNNRELRNDPAVLEMISKEQTESVFQFESNLFKSIIKDMQPSSFEDCIALTSVARPGPLGAGLDKVYSNRKHGIDTDTEFILGKFPYMESTYNTTLYQEQPMLLAKDIAGFSDNQADSYLRKAMAKKKRELLELCKQWFIYGKPEDEYGPAIKGGIANGYKEEDLKEYFDSLDSYCSYLFNKSHATSYSLNSMITAWLKHYYPVEFYASVLSIQDNEDKRVKYMEVIEEQFNITTKCPDINKSTIFFTPDPETNTILFGLNNIKGVGEAALSEIIAGQPYASLEDFLNRTPKKSVNKKVVMSLIKAGAFDCFNQNRYALINEFFKIRKIKDEPYNEDEFCVATYIEFETETLGTPLTAKPWFSNVEMDTSCTFDARIVKVSEKYDRNGKLMAFVKVETVEGNIPLELVVFSSTYARTVNYFDTHDHTIISVTGKKTDKAKVVVNKVRETTTV
jgi:DNA polymerase-3 subunit alpha